MLFSQCYGSQLDIQLGSSDTSQLFTTDRRKKAVNDAMTQFVVDTACTKTYGAIAMVDETATYDLELEFIGVFLRLAGDPSIQILSGSNVRTIQGLEFQRFTPEQLDREYPGWLYRSSGTPFGWYLKRSGGRLYLGTIPAPNITGTDTWYLHVPYITNPDVLSDDSDVPFTVSGNVMATLAPYHQGLVHYAAAQLEPLRKNMDGVAYQMRLYQRYVDKWNAQENHDASNQVQFTRNYYADCPPATDTYRT